MQSVRGTIRACLNGPGGKRWLQTIESHPEIVSPLGFIIADSKFNIHVQKGETGLSDEEVESAVKKLISLARRYE